MSSLRFLEVAGELESAGLIWKPEIGDEIAPRQAKNTVSILVDPEGMTPRQLRETYLWLPNVEQIVEQIELRQAILYHTGLEITSGELFYKTVIRSQSKLFESVGENFRLSIGRALKNLLVGNEDTALH